MLAPRRRAIVIASLVFITGWVVAITGFMVARSSKVTPEKVAAYLKDVDPSALSGEARAKALSELARQINALSVEERRRARRTEDWEKWFRAMNDDEKGTFIEATLPTGFKQMLTAFEQLPQEKRRQAIDRTMRQLARARDEEMLEDASRRTNRAPGLSPELQQKVINIGLKSFYNDSSSQTRAELAPVLEEMQRVMESGALFRGGPH